MRAVVNTPDGVEIREVPEPGAGAGEFVLAVEATSLNRGELALLRARPDGWRPGQDVAGTVVEAATDGTGPAAGTRAVAVVDGGGWAERVTVPVGRSAPLPDAVGPVPAATLPIAGLTALRTVRIGGDLLGRRVLVTGANGGLGRFQVELAAAAGASVTAVTTRGGPIPGADVVIRSVAEAAGPFDLALESVGGASLTGAVASIAPGGTVVVLGNSSGEPAPLSVYDFLGHEGARLQNFMSYASGRSDDADLRTLVSLVAAGRLTPSIGHVAPWENAAAALDLLAERKVTGKVVLTFG